MAQFGGDLDLAQEPLGPERRGQLGAQHLDGDQSVVLAVAGEVDRRHPPVPQLTLDREAVGKGGGESGEVVSRIHLAAPPGIGERTTPMSRTIR